MAEFTGVSESHIYALLNGTRQMTDDIADKIAVGFNLRGSQLLNPSYKLTSKIRTTPLLVKFYKENKRVHDYFITARSDRKTAHFIENDLLNSTLFNNPVYVWEVRKACEASGKKYTSKRVSQILNYLVTIKKLKSKKKPIKLKNGTPGKRAVDVFYKPHAGRKKKN
ncbi:helix-turn-helix domain-containing protein [Terrimonas pollutisoli]|uniref:helix-turn-helix domain-containing protein n=1 Tax=Terrimonas pollutisoli TaxID=3034147 RepID=UPI0023EAC77B|nr:helix-turn-helix transcriptional regulator [Terrimonas sp. H1YJ31]